MYGEEDSGVATVVAAEGAAVDVASELPGCTQEASDRSISAANAIAMMREMRGFIIEYQTFL